MEVPKRLSRLGALGVLETSSTLVLFAGRADMSDLMSRFILS